MRYIVIVHIKRAHTLMGVSPTGRILVHWILQSKAMHAIFCEIDSPNLLLNLLGADL